MRHAFLLFAMIAGSFAFAQQDGPDLGDKEVAVGFTTETQWNFDDFYLGFGMGVELLTADLGLRLSYSFRPYFKKIQVRESDQLIQQFHEKRFIISLDGEKRYLPLSIGKADFGAFANLKLGVVFGNYKGTDQKAASGFLVSPSIGPCFGWSNRFYLKFGYNYMPDRIDSVKDPKVYMGLSIAFR